MPQAQYIITTNSPIPHNTITLRPKVENIVVKSISTIDTDGVETFILEKPAFINGETVFRYKTVTSNKIILIIDHELSGIVNFSDLLFAEAALDYYSPNGKYTSEEEIITFNELASLVYDISNVGDALFDTNIHIMTYDIYGNGLYGGTIPVSVNNDRKIVKQIEKSGSTELQYEPSDDIYVLHQNGAEVKQFEIDGKFISVEVPEDDKLYAIYTPKFVQFGIEEQINENISVLPTFDIKMRDSGCDTIKFVVSIEVYNIGTLSVNSTPIIKTLGLITSDK